MNTIYKIVLPDYRDNLTLSKKLIPLFYAQNRPKFTNIFYRENHDLILKFFLHAYFLIQINATHQEVYFENFFNTQFSNIIISNPKA